MNANIEKTIEEALNKVQKKQEKELCRYLPGKTGGYLHHFSMRKLKKNNPDELRALINEFILHPPQPRSLDPKPRARRGLRNKLALDQTDIQAILKLALKTGDEHLLSKLKSKQSLAHLKRDLIRSIKANRVDEALWHSYAETVELQQK